MTSDDIIFIRDGKYVGHAYYLNLTDTDVTNEVKEPNNKTSRTIVFYWLFFS